MSNWKKLKDVQRALKTQASMITLRPEDAIKFDEVIAKFKQRLRLRATGNRL